MRPFITLFLLFFFLQQSNVSAQQGTDTYSYFDAAWKPVKEKRATCLLRIRHPDDTSWQYSYYNMYGPLIRQETYRDEHATIRHGFFAWYNRNGDLDSSGYYDNGLKDKEWLFLDENEQGKINSLFYDKGAHIKRDIYIARERAHDPIDSTYPDFKRTSPESQFPGGRSAWLQYLNSSFQYPARAIKNFVMGTVVVSFKVAPTGKTEDIHLFQSVEISVDDQACQTIRNSPLWIPAIYGPIKVKSYKRQPVTFRLTR